MSQNLILWDVKEGDLRARQGLEMPFWIKIMDYVVLH